MVLAFCPLIRILQLSFFIPNCGYLELESFVLICHCHRSGQIWLSFWSLWVISFQTLTSHRHLLLLTSKPVLYHGSSLALWQNYRLQMTYTLLLLCSIKSWSSLLLLLLKIRLDLLLSQVAGSMFAHNFSGIVSISLYASWLPFITLYNIIFSQCFKGRLTYYHSPCFFHPNLLVECNFCQL